MSSGNPYLNAGRAAGGLPSGNPYLHAGQAAATATPVASTAPKRSGSLLGNLAGDLGSAVTGFIPGVAATVQHPVRAAEQIAHAEYQTWAPFVSAYTGLFTGDLARYKRESKKFDTQFHAHPLRPLIDLATFAGLGAARVGALSKLPEGATAAQITKAALRGQYQGPLRTITVKAAEGGGKVTVRTLPRNAARAARMEATDKLLKLLPPETRLVGEYARAARALKTETLPTELRIRALDVSTNYLKAFQKLDPRERIALHLVNLVPLRKDLAAWREQLAARAATEPGAAVMLRQIDDPKVLRLYETFDQHPHLVAAHEAERALSETITALKVGRGDLTPEVAAAAPYRGTRLARGARFQPGLQPRTEAEARAALAQLENAHNRALDEIAAAKFGPINRSEVSGRTYENARAKRQASGRNRAGQLAGFSGRKSVTRPTIKNERRRQIELEIQDAVAADPSNPILQRWQERVNEIDQLREALNPMPGEPVNPALFGHRESDVLGGEITGGGNPIDLAAEIQAAGRPLPYYLPDRMAEPRVINRVTRGSGLTPPVAGIHQSQGYLFTHGLLALHPDLLGPELLRQAVRERGLQLHDLILQAARPSLDGNLLHGYRWVRKQRGQRIPHTATAMGQHLHEIEGLDLNPTLTMKEAQAAHAGEEIATNARGQRLMVPDQFARTMEADLARGRNAALRFVNAPLQVWRALILNVRVPWLENNIIGNGIMAAVRFAGPDGLRAVLGMIRETKGAQAARRALGWAESGHHLTRADVNELLPELGRPGTFLGANLPTGLLAKAPGAVQKAAKGPGKVVGFLPSIDRATEGGLRRAAAETVLRGSEEVKALYRAMPAETRSWRAAMRKGIETNPDLRRLVVREVNDALGNFLSLNRIEREALRQVVPFYAWFREISRITAKLPLDAPGRTNLLLKVGQVGAAEGATFPVPSYLEGNVPLGQPAGDLQRILALRSANPYTSAVDTATAVGTFLPHPTGRNANALLGTLNPFIQAGVTYLPEVISGKASGAGLLGETATGVARQLPEVRIGTNPPSRLYPTRTRQELLEQFFGSPVRTVSRQQAAYYHAQGK